MPKKPISFLLILPLVMTGCAASRQIESAAVIETVSVSRQNEKLYYTFYRLTDKDKPDGVSVPADSFEQAQALAERQYIPHLTLAKLELLLYEQDISPGVLRGDLDYISTQASFSPVAYLALCDKDALIRVAQKTAAQAQIEEQLILCKNQNPGVQIDYLSVFNCCAGKNQSSFSVPLITSGGELKVSAAEITISAKEK